MNSPSELTSRIPDIYIIFGTALITKNDYKPVPTKQQILSVKILK